MKSIYGNFGLWAWLRYWYLDSADYITLMLIDKSYYDYDFSEEAIEKRKANRRHNRTHEQQKAIWERMGFGNLRRPGEPRPQPKPVTPEDAQQIIMKEIKERKQ